MQSRRLLVLLVLATITIAGCSGPSQSSDPGGPSPDPDTPPADEAPNRPALAEYETFDVAAYPVRTPEQTVEVTHQVPTRLMQGSADEGVEQTVEGFRIQVFSAQEQKASQEFREEVRQWWEEVKGDAPNDLFGTQPPIVIEYSQPYYRVRIGAFADREVASEALEFVQEEFPEAFVAQSTVTVVR
jgi:hypothetical protein